MPSSSRQRRLCLNLERPHFFNNTHLPTAVHTLRLLIFYLGYAGLALLYTISALSCAGLLGISGRMRIVAFYTGLLVRWVKLCLGITVNISGREHIAANTSYIIVANHQSAFETFLLQTLVNPTCTILKKELLWIPFFGWVLFLIKPIALDRSQRLRALKVILREGKKRLQAGSSILIFPQGTRVAVGELGKWNKAAALLAQTCQASILPIAHNSGECWRKGWHKRPGVINFQIGAPIAAEGKSSDELNERLLDFMRAELPAVHSNW